MLTKEDAVMPEHVPVLIVGAGAAGLSLSLMLRRQGVPTLLIERRASASVYPRARNLNFRSLEVFRELGLAAAVRAAGAPTSRVIVKETLAASDQKSRLGSSAPAEDLASVSPDPFMWYCPQHKLEPLLLAEVKRLGGDVRYSTELVSFSQNEAAVTATVVDRVTGRSATIQAGYLIACDGAYSSVRDTVGVSSRGAGPLPEQFISIYFRAPWRQFVTGNETDIVMINNARVRGVFVEAEGDLGVFGMTRRSGPGQTPEEPDGQACRELLRAAIGEPGLPVEIVDTAHWQPVESVADRFRSGRVFLVGDAAHTMPPYKGLGVNTAIQSAHNLGWKLAAVYYRQASDELLDTYHTERHPVGRFAAQQSLIGPGSTLLASEPERARHLRDKDLPLFYPIIGYRYHSPAVAHAAGPDTSDEIALVAGKALTGTPGTRVPHLWLRRQGQRISTLDLLDGRFTLLTGSAGSAWCTARPALKNAVGIDLAAYRIGRHTHIDADLHPAEPGPGWSDRLGIAPDGAILIRPDGFVAWRSATQAKRPESALRHALTQTLLRDDHPMMTKLPPL
jgi:2-polyprenyl-6-methoxyphenol hydroxylase-like FAD-dependent oxidoreductase